MMYFLDFDRTIFDTDAYELSLLDEPACAAFREDLVAVRTDPSLSAAEHARVWTLVRDAITSGALTLAPGQLASFVYPDAPEILRLLGNEAVIITRGDITLQKRKIEHALADIVRLTVLYTGDRTKAEFLATWPGSTGAPSILVDDQSSELEALVTAFPQMRLYQMRREGSTVDGRWPVIRSLTELPLP